MRNSNLSPWRLFVLRTWLPVLLVVIWWLWSENSSQLYFPPLQVILTNLFEDWVIGTRWRTDLIPSLMNFAVGFGISIGVGTLLGVIIGRSAFMRMLFNPILTFFRALPSPALIPVVLAIFGIGMGMNIALIVLGAIWPTLLNTIDGVRSVDQQSRDLAHSYQFTTWQRIRFIVLPHAGPAIFAGYRISLQISIILIVASEMVGATRGLGHFVIESQQTFMIVQTWTGTIILGLLGYLMTLGLLQVEKRVLAWQKAMRIATDAA